MTEEVINVLGICAGIGGLELGVKLALPQARGVCYIEREAYAQATLVARMEAEALDQAPIWSDLRTFDGRAWRGKVDLVCGGIPCQPFSVAGKRSGIADGRWLWPDFVRVVDETGAWCLFLENVPGLRTKGLPVILEDLAESGWSAEWGLFSAQEVGAPHRRQRLFLLAVTDSKRLECLRGCWVFDSKREALRDHIEGCSGEALAHSDSAAVREQPGRRVREDRGKTAFATAPRIELVNSDGTRLAEREGLTGDARTEHGALERAGRLFPPGRDPALWRGLPAATQPAVCGGAHGAPASVVYRRDRLRALGNGVVPLVAAHAFRSLARRLADD